MVEGREGEEGDLNGKCVHVSSDSNKRRTTSADPGSNTGLSEGIPITNFHQIQLLSHQTTRLDFLKRQLRICVDLPPNTSQPLYRLRVPRYTQHRLRTSLAPHLALGRRRWRAAPCAVLGHRLLASPVGKQHAVVGGGGSRLGDRNRRGDCEED